MPCAQAKRSALSPILYMAISALLWPRSAFSALPPPTSGTPQESSAAPATASGGPNPGASAAASGREIDWSFPPIRWGGNLSYDMRNSSGEGLTSMGRGLMTTLRAATETFLWQPWFSRLNLDLNLTAARNSSSSSWSDSGSASSSGSGSNSLSVSGSSRLNLLPLSRFPFEAHVSRTNSKVNSDLSLPSDYVSTQLGFSQKYIRNDGDAMFGYDRNMQNSSGTGADRQDIVQMSFSHNLKNQRIQLIGNGSTNKRERTGDYTKQGNVTLQHYYSPDLALSLDSMASVSTSDYYLGQSQNDTRLNQLSTQAFWRPQERPMTVTGGARLMTMTSGGNTVGFEQQNARIRTGNANVGASYDASQYLHLNASANVNVTESRDRRDTNGVQSAGASYQPQARIIGGFTYSWSASATAANQAGGENAAHQITTQLSHTLSRYFNFKGESTIGTDFSQSISATKNSRRGLEDRAPSRMFTNTGGVSWSRSVGAANAMARLSLSDSRGLDGNQEYYQMANLQTSGALQTGSNSTWTGNLTIQATRQGLNDAAVPFSANESGLTISQLNAARDKVATTSNGALTYQNSRFFGVRNLRFTSDLRLNSQALLPVLGGPKDQETAAWENRFTYNIGRTQLNMTTLIARAIVPSYSRNADGSERVGGASRTNKSIMFTVSRSFGYF